MQTEKKGIISFKFLHMDVFEDTIKSSLFKPIEKNENENMERFMDRALRTIAKRRTKTNLEKLHQLIDDGRIFYYIRENLKNEGLFTKKCKSNLNHDTREVNCHIDVYKLSLLFPDIKQVHNVSKWK